MTGILRPASPRVHCRNAPAGFWSVRSSCRHWIDGRVFVLQDAGVSALDRADCRPIFRLAKPLSDPDFVRELEEDERRMIAEEKLTPEQVAEARIKHGVRAED